MAALGGNKKASKSRSECSTASAAIHNVKVPSKTSGQILHPNGKTVFERNNNIFNDIVSLSRVDSAHGFIVAEPYAGELSRGEASQTEPIQCERTPNVGL